MELSNTWLPVISKLKAPHCLENSKDTEDENVQKFPDGVRLVTLHGTFHLPQAPPPPTVQL